MNDEPLRIGTRGSVLARRQAETVATALGNHGVDVELVPVETAGDRHRDRLVQRLGRTGAFVRALDDRVLDGELDVAVHSMKDIPTELPDGLVVAAVPNRAEPRDVVVSPTGVGLAALDPGATVGTSSVRRRAQILRAHPDLTVEPVRGNVDTRLEKLYAAHVKETAAEFDDDDSDEQDEWISSLTELERAALDREVDVAFDALVLSGAGLQRIELDRQVQPTPRPIATAVPAAGQGAIAVTMRDGDLARRVHSMIDKPPIRVAVTVERTLLAALGGGCIAPIGINAVVQGEIVHTRVQVLDTDGKQAIEATRDLPIERHLESATELAEELADRGARDLIAAAASDEQ